MTKLAGFIPSLFATTAPTSNRLLLQLLKSRCSDEQFVERVIDVVFSKDALLAAQLLPPRHAQKVIDQLDVAVDIATASGNKRLQKRCLKYLCRICSHHYLLPFSYQLTSTLRRGERRIGSGGFADVWKGVYDGQQVAVKVLKVYETSNLEEIGRRFCREVLMWNRRSHPNILPLLGVSAKNFTMVSQWMENGNIRQYVTANSGVNRPSTLLGAADGLIYLHSQNLVHGDLKGANILILPDGTSCLADFGLATVMPTETTTFSSPASTGGTIRWMSPELLFPNGGDESPRRTVYSDRYAFGMVIYEVLTGNVPFHYLHEWPVVNKVVEGARPEIPIDTPVATHKSGLWTIVQRCWEKDPSERPDLSEVRLRLSNAAEMWDAGLARLSGWMDDYVTVPQDTPFLSEGPTEEESDSEPEPEMSSYSFVKNTSYSTPELATNIAGIGRDGVQNRPIGHRVVVPLQNSKRARTPSWHEPSQPRLSVGLWEPQTQPYDPRQSMAIRIQSPDIAEWVHEDVQSDGVSSEDDLEPPEFVYAKPKSR